jgi:hypothetical protein
MRDPRWRVNYNEKAWFPCSEIPVEEVQASWHQKSVKCGLTLTPNEKEYRSGVAMTRRKRIEIWLGSQRQIA